MLPSGYIPCVGVMPTNNSYVDTGVYPSNTLKVDLLASGIGYYSNNVYLFGARNTNSNSSAGQLGYYCSTTGTNYFCYASARVSMGDGSGFTSGYSRMLHYYNNSYDAEAISESGLVLVATGATTAFTGTRTMYLFGQNNAGSLVWAQYCLHGFVVQNSGGLVYDGEPCYEVSSSKFGVYDRVSGTFAPLSSVRTLYKVSITQSDGGQGYAKTYHREYVKEIYGANHTNEGEDKVHCVAVADSGYSFLNWTDSNGNVVSTNEDFEYEATADVTLTANFLKDVADNSKMSYKGMAMGYASYNLSREPSFRSDIFVDIISGSVTVDSLQRATSTFVLKEVPSALQTNIPIFVFTPKGRCIYQGIIWNIEDKTITCREPIAIWDEDYLFKANTNIGGLNYTNYTVIRNIYRYLFTMENFVADNNANYNYLGQRKHEDVQPIRGGNLQLMEDDNMAVTAPTIESAEVKNMEDYLFEQFEFGIYVKADLATVTEKNGFGVEFTRHCMQVTPFYYRENDEITLGDNSEKVRNISVTEEEMETTVLAWFGEHEVDFKGYYGAVKDGSVLKFDNLSQSELTDLIGYNNYKLKIALTNDREKTVVSQYLGNAKLNHKITFDLELGNLYNFETIKVGTPIKFHYKDRVFESMVTGIKFDFDMQEDAISTIGITLGNVRTSLTSKLNIQKVKK